MFVIAERFIYVRPSHNSWKSSRFHRRWRYIISTAGVQIFKTTTQNSFPCEKSLVERTIQYIKDRTTESFDEYFPCWLQHCKLKHVKDWLNSFINYHNNKELKVLKWTESKYHYWWYKYFCQNSPNQCMC